MVNCGESLGVPIDRFCRPRSRLIVCFGKNCGGFLLLHKASANLLTPVSSKFMKFRCHHSSLLQFRCGEYLLDFSQEFGPNQPRSWTTLASNSWINKQPRLIYRQSCLLISNKMSICLRTSGQSPSRVTFSWSVTDQLLSYLPSTLIQLHTLLSSRKSISPDWDFTRW